MCAASSCTWDVALISSMVPMTPSPSALRRLTLAAGHSELAQYHQSDV